MILVRLLPWRIQKSGFLGRMVHVVDANGNFVAAAGEEETGRLLSAAPELLAASERMFAQLLIERKHDPARPKAKPEGCECPEEKTDDDIPCMFCQARNAIAKATGREAWYPDLEEVAVRGR